MTINNTSRSDLSETATKVHGWKRESFGMGYSTDKFTRATDTIQVTWRDTHAPKVVINGADSTLQAAFELVRSEPTLRDTIRIIGAYHGWTIQPLRSDAGDRYVRDGETVVVRFDTSKNVASINISSPRSGGGSMITVSDALAFMRTPRDSTPWQRLNTHIAGKYENVPNGIFDKVLNEVHVKIGEFEDGYSLWWSDMVANAFVEFHPTLSDTFIRLATLMHCGEAEWSIAFVDIGEFELAVRQFFGSATS